MRPSKRFGPRSRLSSKTARDSPVDHMQAAARRFANAKRRRVSSDGFALAIAALEPLVEASDRHGVVPGTGRRRICIRAAAAQRDNCKADVRCLNRSMMADLAGPSSQSSDHPDHARREDETCNCQQHPCDERNTAPDLGFRLCSPIVHGAYRPVAARDRGCQGECDEYQWYHREAAINLFGVEVTFGSGQTCERNTL